MNKTDFMNFLQDDVLPLFTGSEIIGEEPSSSRDNCVAQGDSGAIKIKFKRTDNYRIIVKRAQPFKNFEVHLIKSIIDEMNKIYNIRAINEYRRGIENMIIEKAICKSLTGSSIKTLSLLFTELSYWGQRTYEGNKTSFGCVVTRTKSGSKTNPNLHISKFFERDFSALLTDGKNSFMEISADGYVMDYICTVKHIDYGLYAPYNQLKLATHSTGAKIGICLTEDGDILVFKDRCLLFAKRGGTWLCYSHEEIVEKLSERAGEHEDVRRAIYMTALDTSFTRTGGCIVHVNNNESINVLRHINDADVLDEESFNSIQQIKKDQSFFSYLEKENDELPSYNDFLMKNKCVKASTLNQLIKGKKFQELDRKFRQELIAMDGATIIGYDGRIIAVGAIIKIEAGSSGGGRLAAAKTLSNYGVAIKISNDGSIQGFKMDRNKLRPKAVFAL